MTEKRKYPRFACKIKAKIDYYPGNPDEIDLDISVPKKIKGLIMDASKGGAFVVTNERVTVGSPVRINFTTKKSKYSVVGHIVRIVLLRNNPSEDAVRLEKFADKGDSYMAVEFSEPLETLNEDEL